MDARSPTVTAHTGCHGTPENTVESALEGIRLGADIVEVDVRADADGVLYLRHDPLDPPAGGAAPAASARVAGVPGVTTLAGLARALANEDVGVNLDLKDDIAAELVGEAVRGNSLEGRAHLTGCGIHRVAIARRRSPRLPVYLNTSFGGIPPAELDQERLEAECRAARDAECRGLNIHHRFCTDRLVRIAHANGLLVSVWTVTPADGMERFVDMGADNITTLHVAELVAIRRLRTR